MKVIKELLFGKKKEPVCKIQTTFHSVYPKRRPSQWEWMKEFNVSILYDKKIRHIN